jgi:hypothetical protein
MVRLLGVELRVRSFDRGGGKHVAVTAPSGSVISLLVSADVAVADRPAECTLATCWVVEPAIVAVAPTGSMVSLMGLISGWKSPDCTSDSSRRR